MEIIKNTSTKNTEELKNRKIDFIVIHYTAGTTSKTGTAMNTANYFKSANNVSADFVVDDTAIVQYNPDLKNRFCWHCGGSKYATKGGSLYGKCTNANSIGVEVCSTNSTGKMQTANDRSYSFTEAAVNNAVELVKQLMKWYNIPPENVVRHYDVTGKPCPGIIGWNLENGNNENEWIKFKNRFSNNQQKQKVENKTIKYTIQVGAFSEKENAENYLKNVQKYFPNAFIKEKE